MAQTRDDTSDRLPQQTRPRHSPSSSLSTAPTLRKQSSIGRLPLVTTSSAGASPRTSRNTSPSRKDSKSNTPSSQTSAQPSAATIQRALSASNIPQIATATKDAILRLPRAAQLGAEEAPHWPVSPRLKSPPPSASKRTPSSATVIRKADDSSPVVQTVATSAAPSTQVQSPRQLSTDSTRTDSLQTPAKNASRGPSGKSVLATVDENSSDTIEPSPAARQAAADLKPLTKLSDDDKPVTESEKASKAGESGSESGGNKSEGRTTRRPSMSQQVHSRTKGNYPKVRQSEGSGNMTVETETVQSIPHSGLGSERGPTTRGDGILKVKSSTETIRPSRKDRRPASRKPRSVTGNASTKADIFEARVASAVGEANSSDSDETFVYESNPPEPRTHRQRHHSRTPSVTSAHSTADQRSTVRNIGEALANDERRVAGKRSMKFSNNPFNSSDSPTDRQDGTVRSHHQPRHYGRWGRGGSHASMFDQPDSPFTAASKLRSNPHSLRHSRPNSPRSPQNSTSRGIAPPVFGRKKDSPFDFDVEGDMDERTPLMRTPRSRHASRMLGDNDEDDEDEELDEYYNGRRRGRCGTLSGCLLGVLIFILVASSTIGFLVMSNRPLADVHIRHIENVLASEEELMLDLNVAAVNPNALSVSIAELDVNIFAKSRYLTSPREPGKKTLTATRRRRTFDANRDGDLEDLLQGHGDKGRNGDDSPEDSDAALWLLGQALKFDQPLVFDGTPWNSKLGVSIGALRLAHPGNKTETGSAGWEKIVHHPFELLIRGVLKYNLPVSARLEAVTVAASVLVHPEDGLDDAGRMRVEPVDHGDHWQWIDWERERKGEP